MKRCPYDILTDFAKASYKVTINDIICSQLILNYYSIPNLKITELAKKCNVSTPSVIRFCREMGYENYRDFKITVTKSIQEMEKELQENGISQNRAIMSDYDQWIDNLHVQAKKGINSEIVAKIHTLSQAIVVNKNIGVFGNGFDSLAGDYLRLQLLRAKKSVVAISKIKIGLPLLIDSKDTVLIVLNQNPTQFMKMIREVNFYNKCYPELWLITQQPITKEECKLFQQVIMLPSVEGDTLMNYYILVYAIQMIVNQYHYLLKI